MRRFPPSSSASAPSAHHPGNSVLTLPTRQKPSAALPGSRTKTGAPLPRAGTVSEEARLSCSSTLAACRALSPPKSTACHPTRQHHFPVPPLTITIHTGRPFRRPSRADRTTAPSPAPSLTIRAESVRGDAGKFSLSAGRNGGEEHRSPAKRIRGVAGLIASSNRARARRCGPRGG